VVRAVRAVYTPALRWSLNHRRFTALTGLAFLGFSGFIASRLGSEFLPTLEEGNLWIRASLPPTISLEAGMPVVNKIRLDRYAGDAIAMDRRKLPLLLYFIGT